LKSFYKPIKTMSYALDNVMAKSVEEGKIKPAPTQLSVNNDEEGND